MSDDLRKMIGDGKYYRLQKLIQYFSHDVQEFIPDVYRDFVPGYRDLLGLLDDLEDRDES